MRYDLKNRFKADAARAYFENLLEKGEVIELTKVSRKRSIDQNGLYWMWLTCIERELGVRKEEFHLLYRSNFLYRGDDYVSKIILPELLEKIKRLISSYHYFKGLDEIIDIISKSTASLNIPEMTEYMNKIKDHAIMELGILLPEPDDRGYHEFTDEYGK